ncbi:MAG: ribosome maturation factor RimM [Candidatus Obscuribacterales bacterium]|nr:ribosome maturation factor RimM [Candidatus Obscuribacterales bacterium]
MDSFNSKIAKIVGFKGLKGDIKLSLETDFDLICGIKSVKLTAPISALNVEGQDSKAKTSDAINARVDRLYCEGRLVLLRLKGFADRTACEKLLGYTVYTEKEQLRALDEDEWWVEDLIGLTVYTRHPHKIFGKVSTVYGDSNMTLAVCDKAGKEFLVPFVKALVPVVNIAEGRIEIENIPGLLEETQEEEESETKTEEHD